MSHGMGGGGLEKWQKLSRIIWMAPNYYVSFQDTEYCSEALEEFDYWLSRVERKLATTLKKPTTRSEASQILTSTKVIPRFFSNFMLSKVNHISHYNRIDNNNQQWSSQKFGLIGGVWYFILKSSIFSITFGQ